MDIKVGQWGRLDNGVIAQLKELIVCGKGTFKHNKMKFSNGLLITYVDKIIKVANTPQELVEHKDLVFMKDGGMLEWCKLFPNKHKKGIVKILTPNGKDYICQWEVTK